MRTAQSYIVRVYARSRTDGFAGTVEIVHTGERRGFCSPEELLRIVMHRCAPKAAARRRAGPRST